MRVGRVQVEEERAIAVGVEPGKRSGVQLGRRDVHRVPVLALLEVVVLREAAVEAEARRDVEVRDERAGVVARAGEDRGERRQIGADGGHQGARAVLGGIAAGQDRGRRRPGPRRLRHGGLEDEALARERVEPGRRRAAVAEAAEAVRAQRVGDVEDDVRAPRRRESRWGGFDGPAFDARPDEGEIGPVGRERDACDRPGLGAEVRDEVSRLGAGHRGDALGAPVRLDRDPQAVRRPVARFEPQPGVVRQAEEVGRHGARAENQPVPLDGGDRRRRRAGLEAQRANPELHRAVAVTRARRVPGHEHVEHVPAWLQVRR